MAKEVTLSDFDKATMACAFTMFLKSLEDADTSNCSIESQLIGIYSIMHLVETFDLEELMDRYSEGLEDE